MFVYIVFDDSGYDREEKVRGVFSSEDAANKHVKSIIEHNHRLQIPLWTKWSETDECARWETKNGNWIAWERYVVQDD